jgi:predicted nucleic acid-binding protein
MVVSSAMTTVVVTDANVLINLMHVGRLSLLDALESYEFVVPSEVLAEICEPDQRMTIDNALMAGFLREISVDSVAAVELFGVLRDVMGRGEAACLALAATAGFHIASDEKRRFRRRAIELIGESRIVRTETLILEAIRAGHLSVSEADQCKVTLEAKRYALSFKSFGELL